jgi:hypothetical protein
MTQRRIKPGGFSALERHAAERLAMMLIVRGVRIYIARWATDLPLYQLRAMHLEIRGTAPRGGPLIITCANFVKTRRLQMHASLFASVLQKIRPRNSLRVAAVEAMVQAYDIYRALAQHSGYGEPLDINAA